MLSIKSTQGAFCCGADFFFSLVRWLVLSCLRFTETMKASKSNKQGEAAVITGIALQEFATELHSHVALRRDILH